MLSFAGVNLAGLGAQLDVIEVQTLRGARLTALKFGLAVERVGNRFFALVDSKGRANSPALFLGEVADRLIAMDHDDEGPPLELVTLQPVTRPSGPIERLTPTVP